MAENQDPSGLDLKVSSNSKQGGRLHMEDRLVTYHSTSEENELLYAYFAVFDGHGGAEAADYAKEHLRHHIVWQEDFWSENDRLVLRAIRRGFRKCHNAMLEAHVNWPKPNARTLSKAGTTASVAFIRRGKLFIGHVGDSGIVVGTKDPDSNSWKARQLTVEHAPGNPGELARIQEAGGTVKLKNNTARVVWKQPRYGHKGPITGETQLVERAFLSVSRSLGDFWSYNPVTDEYVVSPEPDTKVIEIDPASFRCLIIGSDGLWNVVSPQEAVNGVRSVQSKKKRELLGRDSDPKWTNPSTTLVDEALKRWLNRGYRSDNTTAITVIIDPVHSQNEQNSNPSIPTAASVATTAQSGSDSLPPPELSVRSSKMKPTTSSGKETPKRKIAKRAVQPRTSLGGRNAKARVQANKAAVILPSPPAPTAAEVNNVQMSGGAVDDILPVNLSPIKPQSTRRSSRGSGVSNKTNEGSNDRKKKKGTRARKELTRKPSKRRKSIKKVKSTASAPPEAEVLSESLNAPLTRARKSQRVRRASGKLLESAEYQQGKSAKKRSGTENAPATQIKRRKTSKAGTELSAALPSEVESPSDGANSLVVHDVEEPLVEIRKSPRIRRPSGKCLGSDKSQKSVITRRTSRQQQQH